MTAWITYGFDKLIADAPAPDKAGKALTVYMAKGEGEGCQIAFKSETDTDVCLRHVDGEGVSFDLYSMHRTHRINGKEYTDAIIPYSGEILPVKAGITLPFYIDFKTDENTAAGEYEFAFELVSGGRTVETLKATVHVWSITLPRELSFATATDIYMGQITMLDSGESDIELFKQYYNMLLDNNLSGYRVPYDILSPEADEYMSNPRVTSFMVPHDVPDEKLLQYREKVLSNPVWAKKAYFYPFDEPHQPEHLPILQERCERLIRLCPEIPCTSPFYLDMQVGEGRDQVDHMAQYIKLWCPKICLWDDDVAYADLDYRPEPFAKRMEDMQKRGDTMWAYVCNDPIMPWSQLFLDTPGNVQKAMFWQMFERDVTGFLYWSSTSWGYHGAQTDDPWTDPFNGVGDGVGNPVYGEGYLFFPGAKIGRPGPIGTLRLKICRDGVDEMELFALASKYLGGEWVKAKLYEAAISLVDYADNDKFESVRVEIGNALEKAMNK